MLPDLPDSLTMLITDGCHLPLLRNKDERMDKYIERWRTYQSERRVKQRTALLKEELIAAAWHPNRVAIWLEAGALDIMIGI